MSGDWSSSNGGTPCHPPWPRTGFLEMAIPAAAVLLVLFYAINADSFALDEVTTATLSAARSPGEFIRTVASTGSEMQMPLFALCAWFWGQSVGQTEWFLRAMNLPWAMLAVLAMAWLLRQLQIRGCALLLLITPFLCTYINEARPYLMSLATATLSLAAWEFLLNAEWTPTPGRRTGLAWCLLVAGLTACVATSLLNLFLLPALAAYAACHPCLRSLRPHPLTRWVAIRTLLLRTPGGKLAMRILVTAILFFTIFYLWTYQQNYGGQREPFRPTNVAAIFFEGLGLAPLGAPKYLFREQGFAALWAYRGPLTAGIAIGMAILIFGACRFSSWRKDPPAVALLSAFVVGGALLAGVAFMTGVSLWARHFIFLYPFFVALLARIVLPSGQESVCCANWLPFFLLISLYVFTDIRLRTEPEYGKDPYRESFIFMAKLHHADPHLPVIWCAHPQAPSIYASAAGQGDTQWATPYRAGDWDARRLRKWIQIHPVFFLALHREDKMDPAGLWRRVLDRYMPPPRWESRGFRIYRVDTRLAGSAKG